jgi:hypothetical protein
MANLSTAKLDPRGEALQVLAAGGDLDDARLVLASATFADRVVQPYAEELLELAVDAYALTGAGPDAPIELAGLAQRYLPEHQYRGNVEHRNLRYALTYPAQRAGGLHPNNWDDLIYWRSPLWPYTLHAVLADLRIAAEHAGSPVNELAQQLQLRS